MNKTLRISFGILVLLILITGLASAMTINSVDADNFSPGEEQKITLEIKNTLDENVKDISVELDISKVPFIIISSEEIDKIDEDDSEDIDIKIKTTNDAKAGDYSVPYVLRYKLEDDSEDEKEGNFIFTIEANPELSFSIIAENPIIGNKGEIKFTIVNKGFGDAKFVNVKITPEGYTLLSADNDYIGTISSDDFETISLDVIFKKTNPTLNAEIEYKDFDNEDKTESVVLPIKVYSNEEALDLGIIKKDNTLFYIGGGVIIFAVWMIIRKIRKKRKQNKSQGK